MVVLVTGGNGKFSHALRTIQNETYTFKFVDKQTLDIRNRTSIAKSLDDYKPDIVIHAAALTRPMSEHTNNPDISIDTNVVGTANIVLECMQRNIKVVYISTDFVYEGKTGMYTETDPVLPVNDYAWSKLGGECSVMLYKNSLILRMAMTEEPFPHKFAISDVYKSSIKITEAAEICVKVLDQFGIINVGGNRKTIFDFAKEANADVMPIQRKEITDTTMPFDISMDLRKLHNILERS